MKQLLNGSPVNPFLQEQIALWCTTLHWAFSPHCPIHGLTHFWFTQARSCEHSELKVHSGLHEGGVPRYVARHEQTGCLFISLHSLLGPHGDGTQGLLGNWGISKETKFVISLFHLHFITKLSLINNIYRAE